VIAGENQFSEGYVEPRCYKFFLFELKGFVSHEGNTGSERWSSLYEK
jgi:hypothetical protein